MTRSRQGDRVYSHSTGGLQTSLLNHVVISNILVNCASYWRLQDVNYP